MLFHDGEKILFCGFGKKKVFSRFWWKIDFAGKCDFVIFAKKWFYDYGGKMWFHNFGIKCFFVGKCVFKIFLREKNILRFLWKKVIGGFLRKYDFVVLERKWFCGFNRKNDFVILGKKYFAVLVKKYDFPKSSSPTKKNLLQTWYWIFEKNSYTSSPKLRLPFLPAGVKENLLKCCTKLVLRISLYFSRKHFCSTITQSYA